MTTKRQPSWSPHRLWYRVRQHPILAGVLALLGFGVIGVGVSMSGGKLLATWSIESAAALAVSPDGQMFAVAGGPTPSEDLQVSRNEYVASIPVQFRRVADGQLLQSIPAVTARSLAYSPDGQTLAVASATGVVSIWDASNGTLQRSLPGHYFVTGGDLAFSRDGAFLGVGDGSGTVKLYTREGTLRYTFKELSHVDKVAFSPDGTLLAAAADGGNIYIWQVQDGKLLHSWSVGAAAGLAFSPDGQWLAVGTYEPASSRGAVQLWSLQDLAANRPARILQTTQWPMTVAFSPDGQYLAVGEGPRAESSYLPSFDLWPRQARMEVWRTASWWRAASFTTAHPDVIGLAWLPDSRRLLTSGYAVGTKGSDGFVSLWQVR